MYFKKLKLMAALTVLVASGTSYALQYMCVVNGSGGVGRIGVSQVYFPGNGNDSGVIRSVRCAKNLTEAKGTAVVSIKPNQNPSLCINVNVPYDGSASTSARHPYASILYNGGDVTKAASYSVAAWDVNGHSVGAYTGTVSSCAKR